MGDVSVDDSLKTDELVETLGVIDEMTELIAALEESGVDTEIAFDEMEENDVKSR